LCGLSIAVFGRNVMAGFVHPGIALNKEDLETLKANLNREPWASAYAALKAVGCSSLE